VAVELLPLLPPAPIPLLPLLPPTMMTPLLRSLVLMVAWAQGT